MFMARVINQLRRLARSWPSYLRCEDNAGCHPMMAGLETLSSNDVKWNIKAFDERLFVFGDNDLGLH